MKRSPIQRKTPLAGSKMRRKPTKPRKGADPAYVTWLHGQECIALKLGGFHAGCTGRIEQSHARDITGMGRKEPDRNSVPMCTGLHRAWEQHSGYFTGWSKAERREFMATLVMAYNANFDAETRANVQAGALAGGVLAP